MRNPTEELAHIPLPEVVVDRDLLERVHRRGDRIRRRRTALASVAGVGVVGAIAAPLAVAAGLGGSGGTPVTAGPAASGTVSTVLTLEAPGCEGCEFQLHQGRWDDQAPSGATVWHSDTRTVHDGRVTFTVPKARTQGMSITFHAPWEGQLPGSSTVAMAYQDRSDDSDVSTTEARASKAASACWAGTQADTITIGVVTDRVETYGVHEPVLGTRAYTERSMSVEPPMREVYDGVLSSADDNICGPRP